mmetsp:Transcript_8464/g.24238  ORF Transcript_8464/g.24238 Transcript_8464/m.24238 type:complete len:210 (-) Transcript_8464:262-891(-)
MKASLVSELQGEKPCRRLEVNLLAVLRVVLPHLVQQLREHAHAGLEALSVVATQDDLQWDVRLPPVGALEVAAAAAADAHLAPASARHRLHVRAACADDPRDELEVGDLREGDATDEPRQGSAHDALRGHRCCGLRNRAARRGLGGRGLRRGGPQRPGALLPLRPVLALRQRHVLATRLGRLAGAACVRPSSPRGSLRRGRPRCSTSGP